MGYIDKAKEMGAVSFSTPSTDVWNALADPWLINKQFLDDAVARGDRFFVEENIDDVIRSTSEFFLKDELNYLTDIHGYVREGRYLVKP